MAALEIFAEGDDALSPLPSRRALHAVSSLDRAHSYRVGPLVANRRAARARMKARRRRNSLVALVAVSLVVLAWPGHAFGGTNGVGLSTDLASSSTLSSGMVYVVEPGDTISSIARELNPVSPWTARRALVAELHSRDVVVGEHVLIP